MLNNRQIEQYLTRIDFKENLAKNTATLNALHKAHMENVPFENLDIHLGSKISLSKTALFEKIVLQSRGGFCYELNYLFSELLNSCGFNVSLLSAQVFDGDTLGREYDHLLLLVELGDELIIADVGFGDSFIEPLRLGGGPVKQFNTMYKFVSKNNKYILFQKNSAEEWQAQYAFSLTPHHINAFTEMCEFQQTSPQSNFTKKSVCSVATKTGRKTISNGKFIETIQGSRSEFPIRDSKQYRELLKQHSRLPLPDDISLKTRNKLIVGR